MFTVTAPQRAGTHKPFVRTVHSACPSASLGRGPARQHPCLCWRHTHQSGFVASRSTCISTRSCCWGCFLVTPFTLLRETDWRWWGLWVAACAVIPAQVGNGSRVAVAPTVKGADLGGPCAWLLRTPAAWTVSCDSFLLTF